MKALSVGSSCSICNQGGRSGNPNLEAINFTSVWPAEWHTKIQTLVSPMETYTLIMKITALKMYSVILYINPFLIPLSSKNDQHEFSQHFSRENIVRIYDMNTKGKMLWSLPDSPNNASWNVWRSVWRICMWILWLKGSKVIHDLQR